MHDSRHIMPFGPQHPGLKEPIFFKLKLDGTQVTDAEIHLGYIHRGIEKLIEGKNINQALHTVEHVCGICSFVHSECCTTAIEKGSEIQVPEIVKLERMLIAELERIHSHMLWLGVSMHEIGFETGFMFFMREREKILDVFDKLTGGRVHHSINMIGTAKKKFSKEELEFTKQKVAEVEEYVKQKQIFKTPQIIERYKEKGIITRKDAENYGLTGPNARASGIDNDVRKIEPYELYDKIKYDEVTAKDGDALARMKVRLDEISESRKIIEQIIEMFPNDKDVLKIAVPSVKKDFEAYGRAEAPRGEDFHYIQVKDEIITRYKIRTPTFSSVAIYPELLKGAEVADVPIILESMDPCFGCMERLLVVDNEKADTITGHEFKHKYCSWYHD